MCEGSSDRGFERVRRRLASARSLLVLSHARPDGDALGSMIALAIAARAAGREVRLLLPDGSTERYAFLREGWEIAEPERFGELADAVELVVIVDTCSFRQLDEMEGALRERRDKIVVVDHHATRDDVSDDAWVDVSAAAAGVMAGELIEALGWPVDPPTAEALATAVLTDTGWLRFSNTDGRCLRQVARWVDSGVRPDALYRRIYQNDRPRRLALLARMLDGMELRADDRLAVMTIRRADFEATGAKTYETENLINEALRIATVEMAVLLVEHPEVVRVSLRSREAIDVSEIASRFGGGGHARAAGLRLEEDIDALKARIVETCEKALGNVESPMLNGE